MIRLQLNQHKILPKLLGQIFSSYLVQKQVKRFSVGGIMDGLSMGIINKLKFVIPSSIEEQTKVADYLSSLDTKIESVATQITQSQTFKKGLLQQMFV
jgi:type I restriction enzyme S subunit